VLAGFLLMLPLTQARLARATVTLATLFCLSIHERGALIAGLKILACVALYWRSVTDRWFKFALGITTLVAGFVLLKFFVDAAPYGSFLPGSLDQTVDSLRDALFRGRAFLYLETSLPLLFVAFFAWRAGLIAFIMMLPRDPLLHAQSRQSPDVLSAHNHISAQPNSSKSTIPS